MRERLLQAQELCFAYEKGRPALDHVTVSFDTGEKVAVIGANGSGKSTFFLNLNGVLTPDAGQIFYRGHTVGKKEKDKLRRHVGVVFQDADQQIIAPTVMAEVSFGPMNLKLEHEEVRRRTVRAMEEMNLSHMAGRAPHMLSGGEKKRVTIADILAMEPEIILFDEPTTALDPVSRRMLEETLEQIAGAGRTVVISTHDLDFACRFAERVLVFKNGHILADGPAAEIFENERLLDEAGLSPPQMTKVTAILRKKGILPAASGSPRSPEELEQLLSFLPEKKEVGFYDER